VSVCVCVCACVRVCVFVCECDYFFFLSDNRTVAPSPCTIFQKTVLQLVLQSLYMAAEKCVLGSEHCVLSIWCIDGVWCVEYMVYLVGCIVD